MDFVIILVIGFFISFLGSASPSLLNISCLKVSLEKNKKAATLYSLGVSIITFPQVFIGIFLAKEINNYPNAILFLERAATLIFLLLSYYFYREYKKETTQKNKKENAIKNPLFYGFILATINMFAIPFYFGAVTSLSVFGFFSFESSTNLFFAIGSSLGTFVILNLYGKFARKIDKKLSLLTKKINIVLSILTGGIAILSLLKVFQ